MFVDRGSVCGHTIFKFPCGIPHILLLASVACYAIHYVFLCTSQWLCFVPGTFVVCYVAIGVSLFACFAVHLVAGVCLALSGVVLITIICGVECCQYFYFHLFGFLLVSE